MKAFLIGILLACLIGLFGYLTKDKEIITLLSGTVGLVSFLASGLFVGAFVSGDRVRATYQNETKEERSKRIKLAVTFFIIGLPNIMLGLFSAMM